MTGAVTELPSLFHAALRSYFFVLFSHFWWLVLAEVGTLLGLSVGWDTY